MSPQARLRRSNGGRRASTGARAAAAGPALVLCPHCGSMVPAGAYCGHCGAHLITASTARRHAFAAVPSEPVVHLSVVSTLFPHLPHRRGGAFQWALLTAGAAVVVLASLHLFTAATATAVFMLPVLYLLYLYEVEVYESEPWLLIGATMAAGALFGYAFTAVTADPIAALAMTGDRADTFLAAVILPVAALGLMLAGPLFLYFFRTELREPLDGVTFGAASALGFTLTSTLTAIWPLLAGLLFGAGSPLDWAVRLLNAGVLASLINAATTSMVTAAIWLHRYDLRRAGRGWEATILTTLVVAAGAQALLGAGAALIPDVVLQVGLRALVAAALLIYLRFVIHQALLAEGAGHEIGPDAPCPECHRVVPTMLFCPSCGVARSAARASKRRARARAAQ